MTSPKDLRETADLAENVAAGFRQFRIHLPEHSADLTTLMSDLFGISASLTVIIDMSTLPERRPNWQRIQLDLDRIRSSLNYTLEDIYDTFGHIDAKGRASRASYKNAWVELDFLLHEESGYSLGTRLRKYKMFLKELEDTMQEYGICRLLSPNHFAPPNVKGILVQFAFLASRSLLTVAAL